MFPWVAAVVSGFFAGQLFFWIPQSFGWTESSGGFWAFLVIAIIVGIGAGIFVRNKIWIAIAALGAVGGWFGGIMVFTLIADIFNYSDGWLWWVLCIVGGIAGYYMALKLGGPAVNLCTSFIGSYLITVALTQFFWTEHWPSRSEIINGTIPDDLGW